MSHNIEIGNLGERFALQFLKNKEYRILETNWRFSRAEIDIICKKQDILIFVEVKTRSSIAFGEPSAFVNSRKEGLITDAASQYMEAINHSWEFRFDIISVVLHNKALAKIEHIEDAFFPGIEM